MKRICLFLLVFALLLGTVCPTIAEQSSSESWDRIVKMQNEALSSTQTHDGKVDEENMVEINKIRIDGTDYNVKDSDARESIEQLSEENANLSNKMDAITAPYTELTTVAFEQELSYVLDKNTGMPIMMGTVDAPQNSYRISSSIAVTPGEIVVLTASANYNNGVYAFYNAAGECVHCLKDAVGGGTGTTLVDEYVSVPNGASTMRIAYLYTRHGLGVVKRFDENGVQLRKWHGKIWAAVGDSLTEQNIRTTMSYHDYVSDATGIIVVNMGDSGTGYKSEEQNNGAFYQRIANVPTNADVVTIFGSGNDMRYTLGNPTDTGTDTLCGCINTTIDNLIAIMPTVALGIVSPTPWDEYPPSDTDNPMALYVAAMKTICENRSIPFLDLYHCSNLRPWTEEGRAACYTKDDGNGVHPDETGHALIAPRFKAFLETLIL